MESLFQELLEKGLIEVARFNLNWTVGLASSVLYRLQPWELDLFVKNIWRWN